MDAINNKVDNNGGNAQGIYAAGESNQVTGEILKVITASGQTPSAAVLDQLMAGLDKFTTGFGLWCTDTGSSGSYVIANQNSSFTRIVGLYNGLTLKFRPNSNNISATPNLAYRGVTYPIVGEEVPLINNDISPLRDCEIRFNGTTFVVLQRSIARQIANFFPRGHIDGLGISRTTGSILTIGVGECTAQNNANEADANRVNAKLLSSLAKQTVAWVAGNGGGLGSGVTATANTWLRVFIIAGPTVVDAGFDTSISAVNLLSAAGSAYTHYRQIGWIRIDNGGSIRNFKQDSNDPTRILWDDNSTDISAVSVAHDVRYNITTAGCPIGANAIVRGSVRYISSDNAGSIWVDLVGDGVTDRTPSDANSVYRTDNLFGDTVVSPNFYGVVAVDASARYYIRQLNTISSGQPVSITATTTGYIYKA